MLVYADNGNILQAQKRKAFEKSLIEQGLELQYEENCQLHFIKICATEVCISKVSLTFVMVFVILKIYIFTGGFV